MGLRVLLSIIEMEQIACLNIRETLSDWTKNWE